MGTETKGLGHISPPAGIRAPYRSARLVIPPAELSARKVLTHLAPLRDQGMTGSCVGQAKRSQIFSVTARKGKPFYASVRWLYWMARAIRGWQTSDNGCFPTDMDEVLRTAGAPPEALFTWSESGINERPPSDLDAVAVRHQSLVSHEVHSFDEVCSALEHDDPPAIGMTWRAEYDTVAATGIIPPSSSRVRGGHEMAIVGFDRVQTLPGWLRPGYLILQQSWGEGAGAPIPEDDRPCHYFVAAELVDSDEVSDLDALVDMETV